MGQKIVLILSLLPVFFFINQTDAKTQQKINVSLEFLENQMNKKIHIKENLRVELEKVFILKDKRSTREVEVLISEKIPKDFPLKKSSVLFYDLKIFDVENGMRKLIATPQVLGEEGGGPVRFENKGHHSDFSLELTAFN